MLQVLIITATEHFFLSVLASNSCISFLANSVIFDGLGYRIKANCPVVGTRPVGGVLSVGVFLRDPSPVLTWVSEQTTANFERLGQQTRPETEPGTCRLSVLDAESLGQLWSDIGWSFMWFALNWVIMQEFKTRRC